MKPVTRKKNIVLYISLFFIATHISWQLSLKIYHFVNLLTLPSESGYYIIGKLSSINSRPDISISSLVVVGRGPNEDVLDGLKLPLLGLPIEALY